MIIEAKVYYSRSFASGSSMEPLRVSASDFQRNVVRYQDVALRRPVTVCDEGRDRTVLLSIEEYERLKRRDREVLSLEDFTDADIALLEASSPPAESAAFDHEMDD